MMKEGKRTLILFVNSHQFTVTGGLFTFQKIVIANHIILCKISFTHTLRSRISGGPNMRGVGKFLELQ